MRMNGQDYEALTTSGGTRRREKYLAHGAMVLVNVIFGGMNVLLDKIKPSEVNFFVLYRLSLSIPCLWILTLVAEGTGGLHTLARGSKMNFALIGVAGLFGMFVNMFFFTQGLAHSNADIAAVFQPLTPVVSCVVGVIVGTERFSWMKCVGISLAAGGTVLVMCLDGIDGGSVDLVAFVFLVTNATGAAFYAICMKPLVATLPPIFLTAVATMTAWVGIAVVVSVTLLHDPNKWSMLELRHEVVPCLLYCVLMSSVVGYSLMTYAARILEATLVNLYVLLQPVTTAIISLLFGVDTSAAASWSLWTSAVLIGLGLVLTTMSPEKKKCAVSLDSTPKTSEESSGASVGGYRPTGYHPPCGASDAARASMQDRYFLQKEIGEGPVLGS